MMNYFVCLVAKPAALRSIKHLGIVLIDRKDLCSQTIEN